MNVKFIPYLLLLIAVQAKGQQDTSRFSYKKPLFDFNKNKSIFKLKEEQLNNKNRLLRFSAVTGYREGVAPIQGLGNFDSYIDKEHGTVRMYMYNLSIQDMLTFGLVRSNHVLLEVKNPSIYRYDSSQGPKLEWMRKYAHCFEFLFPLGTMKDSKIMEDEIAHFFKIKVGMEKRIVDVLVLIRTSNQDKIKSADKGEGHYDESGYFNNVPLDRLAGPLDQAEMLPIIDETGYTGNVDMDLKISSWKDISALRKALKRYDLDLKQDKREVEMFVIKEIK